MRKIEKKFMRLVGKELTSLNTIASKLKMDIKTAENFMIYLEKQEELRLTKEKMSDGTIIYLVAKPIIKKSERIAAKANWISWIALGVSIASCILSVIKK